MTGAFLTDDYNRTTRSGTLDKVDARLLQRFADHGEQVPHCGRDTFQLVRAAIEQLKHLVVEILRMSALYT